MYRYRNYSAYKEAKRDACDSREDFQSRTPQIDRPRELYNANCGVTYRCVANTNRANQQLIMNFMQSEACVILTVLMSTYFWRTNIIKSKGLLSKKAIASIFDQYFVDFWCPVHEMYKRYLLRTAGISKSGLNKIVTNNMDFSSLDQKELDYFIKHLKKHQKIQHPYRDYDESKLYEIVIDRIGVPCVKLMNNEAARAAVNLLNEANSAVDRWTPRYKGVWQNSPQHEYCFFRPGL